MIVGAGAIHILFSPAKPLEPRLRIKGAVKEEGRERRATKKKKKHVVNPPAVTEPYLKPFPLDTQESVHTSDEGRSHNGANLL